MSDLNGRMQPVIHPHPTGAGQHRPRRVPRGGWGQRLDGRLQRGARKTDRLSGVRERCVRWHLRGERLLGLSLLPRARLASDRGANRWCGRRRTRGGSTSTADITRGIVRVVNWNLLPQPLPAVPIPRNQRIVKCDRVSRLLTLDVRLLLGTQLLIERRKTLPSSRLEAILMAEIPVVAHPLQIIWLVFLCDPLLPQQ